MTPIDSQQLETYQPVYDVIPEEWEESRAFIVEQLKRLAQAINIREVGYLLDQELLTGQSFVPGINNVSDGGTSQTFRSVLRKVIVFPNGVVGGVPTSLPHGITIDANFTLLHMYGAGTNSTALIGVPLPNAVETIFYDATNVTVVTINSYNRVSVTMEYIQEL